MFFKYTLFEDQDDNTENNKLGGINSTLLKMIDKFGLLRKDGGNDGN